MKVVVFHVDNRPRREKIKSYAKISFKVALIVATLAMAAADPVSTAYATVPAFKLGNILY
jgi:hypothetical protein